MVKIVGDDILQIEYDNQRIEKQFSDYNKMSKHLGQDVARSIKKAMDRLRASPSFQTFLSLRLGSPHALAGEFSGCYGINITANIRLIVRPVSADNSSESLMVCSIVVVKGVSDYHGGKNNWIIP